MKEITPRIIENREFVGLEEEDIKRLNLEEASKFERNQNIREIMIRLKMNWVMKAIGRNIG